MRDVYTIIRRPVVTERTAQMKAQANQYVFRVALDASKRDIRVAIEQFFKVKVLSVNTMRVGGKFRRMGNAPGAHRPDWKKAIVTLAEKQEIKVLEEGQ